MVRKLLVAVLILNLLLAFSISVAAQESPVNILVDFSEGLSGWRVFGPGNLEVTTEKARSGRESLIITGRSDGWHSAALDMDALLADGGTYQFSIYVRLAPGTQGEIHGHFVMGENLRNGTTNYNWLSNDVLLSSDEWILIESEPYTFNAREVNTAWLYVEIGDPEAAYYIDDFKIIGDKQLKAVYPRIFERDIPALKEVFSDNFYIGAATSTHFLNEQDIYAEFLSHHYNMLVAGNAMKPDALQPVEGVFRWREADRFVQFAEGHQMQLRGHTLLWHNQIPDWFFEDPADSTKPASREQLIERLETHIKTVVGRYKGKVYSWDVVNEVLNDSGNIRGEDDGSKWGSIIGDLDGDGFNSDYIELAFKFARETDSEARLIINDYGLESPGLKRAGMYNLVKRMLEKGVPVDGVGLQMHISIYGPTVSEIEETIELFASLKEYNPDFTVEVTEMDMSVYRWMEAQKEITQDLLDIQAERYDEIFEVFRRQAAKGNLSAVVLWGMGDNDSWLDNHPVQGRGDAGLLFNKQLQAKPAYYKVIQPDKPWHITKGQFKGVLKLFAGDDILIGTLFPGEYTTAELEFNLSSLEKIFLAKGYILEVFSESGSDSLPRIYIGNDQLIDLRVAGLGERILIKENTAKNLVIGKSIDASHNQDRAMRAVDGEMLTSWSVSGEPPYWLSVDLGKPYLLTQWVVYHRGSGKVVSSPLDGPLNTADFRLQVSNDNITWHDLDIVEGNVLSKTTGTLTPVIARHVRLLIAKPTSFEWSKEAAIYEMEVYGLEIE